MQIEVEYSVHQSVLFNDHKSVHQVTIMCQTYVQYEHKLESQCHSPKAHSMILGNRCIGIIAKCAKYG